MRRSACIGLVAALAAGALQAPPAFAAGDPTTVAPVVVSGQKSPKRPQSFSTQVSKFVDSHAHESPIGTLARWMDPVCPATAGLSPQLDAFVTQRIIEISTQVGAPRGKSCRDANVLVIFTSAPQQLMDDVRKNHPELLGYHGRVQEKDLSTFKGPIEAWRMTGTHWTASGVTVVDDPDAKAKNASSMFSIFPAPSIAVWDQSRLKQERSDQFVFALVVIDADDVTDQPIGAVADHIAMMALSDPGVRKGCSDLPTLLDALDPACGASASLQTLSAYDEAFLKGLYASNPEQTVGLERGTIAGHIDRAARTSAEKPSRSTPPPP